MQVSYPHILMGLLSATNRKSLKGLDENVPLLEPLRPYARPASPLHNAGWPKAPERSASQGEGAPSRFTWGAP